MAGVCVGHPFDTVKVLMQTRSKYTSPWHCLTSLVQEKGIRSLFNGIIPPLGIATAVNAVLFFSYEFSLRIIRRLQRSDEQALRPTLTQIFAAGSLSGLAQIGLGVPAEVSKQMFAPQPQTSQHIAHAPRRSSSASSRPDPTPASATACERWPRRSSPVVLDARPEALAAYVSRRCRLAPIRGVPAHFGGTQAGHGLNA